jgi:hypothetical protein
LKTNPFSAHIDLRNIWQKQDDGLVVGHGLRKWEGNAMLSRLTWGWHRSCLILALIFLLPVGTGATQAQEEKTVEQAELDQLLAPIALYPDALLSQILMAATYPVDVAEAAAWSKANPDQEGDAAVTAVGDKPWDPSVQSLAAFPQVLEMMGDKPEWVQSLGDAFLAQPEDVMDTVQDLRKRAKDEGNLESNQQTTVKVEEVDAQQTIVIVEPADPQVVYVPTYNPTVIYGPWWWPAYPPPFYWYRPGYALAAGISFGVGIAITNALWGGCDWHRHDVNININRYNNINVNKRIDVNRRDVSWKHDPRNRRGVPYRDARSREQFSKKISGMDARKNFRGHESQRDLERKRASQALMDRGIDPSTARKSLRDDKKVREQVSKATQGLGKKDARAAAQKIERDHARTRQRQAAAGQGTRNALRGAGDGGRALANSQRGHSSLRKGGGGRRLKR